jgi:tetratricopeptide (TPR) repeat protein
MERLPRLPRSRFVAAQYWEAKVSAEPDNPRPHRNLAPLLLERGERGERGCAAAALRHLKAAAELNPSHSDSRNDFALALLKAGRVDQAITELHFAVELNPASAVARKNLSAAYAKRGKFREALEHAREATRLEPSDPQAHRNLGRILDAMGNTRDSYEHNKTAILLGPGHLTDGRVRDRHDTETYRVVARQAVARHE